MQIQSTLLRAQIRNLSKENGFLKLKVKMIEEHRSPSQVTIINKQLYLDYMEEVLSYKEKQLLETQKRLQNKNLDLATQQCNFKLLNPLQNSTDIDIFLKKIQQIKTIVITQFDEHSSFQIHEWKQFMKRQSQIVQQCRNYQSQTQNLIKNEYENLIRQRKQLAQSMDKFQELNSYQKYLNQLQKILQAKQKQILQKQDDLFKAQTTQGLEAPPNCLSFGRQNYSVKEPSQKKRLKIFQSANKSQGAKFFQIYESERASTNQRLSHQSNHSQSLPRDESSFIMQQTLNNQESMVKKCQNCMANEFRTQQVRQNVQTESVAVQAKTQLANQSIERLDKQSKIFKFTQLWLKRSIDSKKAVSNTCRKTIGFYLWRLNTVYDSQLPDHLKKTYDWPIKYQQSLKDNQLFPYAELSLNRKKYALLTLDFQRKVLHQNKIKHSLKNVIKSKNFKQRMIFACYFKKYYENVKLKAIIELEKAASSSGKKLSGKQTTIMQPNSRYHTQSHLVSVNSSRVMNEYRPPNQNLRETSKDHKRSKLQQNSKSMSSSNLLNFSQQRVNRGIKENISPSESLDAKKLKQYIKTHEQAQKALAVQCVKTQALCKLGQTLFGCMNRAMVYAFYSIKQHEQNQRIVELQKRINKYEFKWELFMTKCKLALVNNNNKISHLQDTLGFMFSK